MLNVDRTQLLIGEAGIARLRASDVLIVGVGGVGGYVAEMLVRAGVGKLTIVDYDKVDSSNCNRQIIALCSTIGKKKVEVLKQRLLDINSDVEIEAIDCKFDLNTCDSLLNSNFNYVVDAIDDVKNKLLLITACHQRNLPVVSAMGSGNKLGIPHFEVVDIFKTQSDGLAKKIRHGLKQAGIKKHDVVWSNDQVVKTGSTTIGSISYYPAMCGCVISAFIINKILEDK